MCEVLYTIPIASSLTCPGGPASATSV